MTGVDTDLATLREARRSMAASLIAVKGHLDEPYPDDPRWTPWTRFIERELQRLDETKTALSRLEAELSRLREQRDAPTQLSRLREQRDAPTHRKQNVEYWRARSRAAEARLGEAHQECARLQQALAAFDPFVRWIEANHPKVLREMPRPEFLAIALGREALAGPGGEQSSLTESGSAGLPDTPAIPPRPPIQPPGHQREMADAPASWQTTSVTSSERGTAVHAPYTPADFREGHFCNDCGAWVPGGDEHDCTPADSHYRERPIEEDFYLDPRGEWVYRWSDERRVLKLADSQEDKT